jgi:hypothetical protein
MKRSRFSEEQIIGLLKEQEAGMPTVPRHCLSSLQPSAKQRKDSTSEW